jgi:putative nucleotidyltransferase with HDIG domain
VGVVPLVATSFHLVSKSREILELDQKSIQLDKARSLSQQVSTYLKSLQSQTVAIARTLEVDTPRDQFAAKVARIREVDGLKRYVEGTSNFVSVSVVDVRGSGARSGVQLNEPIIEQLLQEGVLRGLQDNSMVSHPVVSTSLQEPVMVLAEPIRPGGGGPQGVVLVVASLGPLWNTTKQMGQEGLFDVYVVDGRGWLVAHSDPARLQGDLDVSGVEIVRQFIESGGRAGATVPFTLPGPKGKVVTMLGTYAAVPESSWGVIVQVEEDKAYYSAIQMRYQSLVLVALVTIAAIVFGMLFAGQISHPIQALARGARTLASGDYDTRVSVKSNNEVGVLADTFNQMGDEIQKAFLEIQRQANVNKELFMGAIRMLANAIDEKDPYTRGHSERVAAMSRMISRYLGLAEDVQHKIWIGALLHDVGKIGVEDHVLRKAGKLSEEEFDQMKAHTVIGAEIMTAIEQLRDMIPAIRSHHEAWNGRGYPDGLKGEQIPLFARIVGVADTFDAITTNRPYQKAYSLQFAVETITRLTGSRFDAKIVTAFLRAFEAGDIRAAAESVGGRFEEDEVQEPARAAAPG